MSEASNSGDSIDWSLATWEGSRREQLRQWAKLDFTEILKAQEEMALLAKAMGHEVYPVANAPDSDE